MASEVPNLDLTDANPLFNGLTAQAKRSFLIYREAADDMLSLIGLQSVEGRLPYAHGTQSIYLPNILEKGLGSEFPIGAIAKSKSLTDASSPDGLIGAYLFAIWPYRNRLGIDRSSVDPSGDIVDRYCFLAPAIWAMALRAQLDRYFERRAQIVGDLFMRAAPALLIYLEDDHKNIQGSNVARVPSERTYTRPLPKEKLAMVLTTETNILSVERFLGNYQVDVPILPIEVIELI